MQYVSGLILTEAGFQPGHIGFEDGMVKMVGEGPWDEPIVSGYILPTFVNAHTHLADFRVPVDLTLDLEQVVAPPHGLKHRYLSQAPPEEIARSFNLLSRKMIKNGISRFIDFREGGVDGAKLLAGIKRGGAAPTIMGRPKAPVFDRDEVEGILQVADGIGVSSMLDWPYEELRAVAELTRSRGKRFALHCSERVREDIDLVLDLRPSFLVHMVEATAGDLELCKGANVPIVVCPRSNMFFGKLPPLAKMVRSGVDLALGTDNAMTALPDMVTEMEFAGRVLRSQGVQRMDPVLDMAFRGGRLILNEMHNIGMAPGSPCDFMVVRSKQGDPVTDLVLRSGERDVRLVCVGKNTWRGWR
jgi:cytosine/adenosine deaminase-related metal-dependent hydrolase